MPSPIPCPDCGSPLDVFQGVVSRQRTYPLTWNRDETVMVVDRVERKAQVVTCSGCTFCDTVGNILGKKVS